MTEDDGSCRSLDAPARAAREAVRSRELLGAASRGDPRARERVVTSSLGLVRAVAARYRDLGLPFDDLVQEGAIGLLEAIDRYDSRRGISFESYAHFMARRAIRNALTNQARLIRLPKHVVERRRALERAEAELLAAGSGAPTGARLAAATGMSDSAVREAQCAGLQPISLDRPLLPDGTPLASLIADRNAGQPELETLEHERSELLHDAVRRLPERERRIVTGHWGLDATPESHEALAGALAISPRRAQTIGREALYKLREALESADTTSAVRL
jgi:RNA polymerase sigma factor (sigma-70 family)